jgi:hypothetical protein
MYTQKTQANGKNPPSSYKYLVTSSLGLSKHSQFAQ